MAGILEEDQSTIGDTKKGTMVRDAGLILAAQKVELYETATYGTLRVFVENMGHTDVAALPSKTLKNKKDTDVAFTRLAESSINNEAAEE